MATLLSNTARVTGAHFRRGLREGPLGRLPLPAPRTVFVRGRCRAYLGRLLDFFQSPGPDIIDVTIDRNQLRNERGSRMRRTSSTTLARASSNVNQSMPRPADDPSS